MQTARVNIPSYIDDINYRYKMPKLIAKIESRGNGIKTSIVNLKEVAQALRVPAEYPLKFIGNELGSQTTYKEKGNDVVSLIKGSFIENLPALLDKFIEKYVICPKCKLPEIEIEIKKEIIMSKCNSCGEIMELDNKHKFASYILKNPPISFSEFNKGQKKVEAGNKKEEKGAKKEKEVKENKDEEQKIKEKDKKKKSKPKHVEFTAKDLPLNSSKLKLMIEKVKGVYQTCCQTIQGDTFDDDKHSVEDILLKLKKFLIPNNIADRKTYIIFNAIFEPNLSGIDKLIKKNKFLIQETFQSFELDENHVQAHILLNLQNFFMETLKDQNLTKLIATVLKYFNDDELLSDEFLIEWKNNKNLQLFQENFLYNEEHDKAFKTAAEPFLNWLDADNEDEDEEEEDEEEEKKD